MNKAYIASVLGTFQSTLTHFPYLRKSWKRNTEEERLLGVSLTGIMDHSILNGTSRDIYSWNSFCGDEDAELPEILTKLKQHVVDTNKEFADTLGIEQSVATTCIYFGASKTE